MRIRVVAVVLLALGDVPLSSEPYPQRSVLPVLAFPEPGIDDTAAYQGYQTRFYRDSKDNTVQIYLQPQTARVVLVWADALNESVGFTAHDAAGRPVPVAWGAAAAQVADSGSARTLEFKLTAPVSRLDLGSFVLGSMRVERDFAYAKRYTEPLRMPFRVAEESLLVAALGRLPLEEQRQHLALLHASSIAELRERLLPTITTVHTDTVWSVTVTRPSLDRQNQLSLAFRVDPRKVKIGVSGNTVSVQSRPGSPVQLAVRVGTDGAPLTPLRREQIFNARFLEFLKTGGTDDSSAIGQRRLERQVRGVELLSSEEKLMAGLPNFATYFGRDMMMTALMMRPIWSPDMAEHVIASVLRKLGPRGDVSHEEALGGQAIRESAVVYDSLLAGYFRARKGNRTRTAEATLARAREALRDLQKTRENYHMIDDEFQLPVLEALYLQDSTVSAERKRRFLLEKSGDGSSRLALMLRELALVAAKAQPYAKNPGPLNLVSFPKRDATHWRSASWRDSDAGYAGGRFAMDINVIWVPQALQSIAGILSALPALGVDAATLDSLTRGSALTQYTRDPGSLRRNIDTWKGARRHFMVTLAGPVVRQRTHAKLAWLPAPEGRYWEKRNDPASQGSDSLTFLALALDGNGRQIPVVNTDPATELFLNAQLSPEQVLEEAYPFLRPYPVGLFVEGLGPLVANDAYASPRIWDRFQSDQYHGPRVVWGREVNLFFLGLAKQISAADESSKSVQDLREMLQRTLAAVSASGLQHNELWSYEIQGEKLVPVRYGTSSDVQLWNTTNLVVQYVLSGLPGLSP